MLSVTDTQTLYRIIDESVEKALGAKESQCLMHAKRLDSFENNQKETIKEMQENNKLLAVVIDNMADMKKTRDMLFDKSNDNSKAITQLDGRVDAHDTYIKEIKEEHKENKTLKWTAMVAIGAVIVEFLINKFGGK